MGSTDHYFISGHRLSFITISLFFLIISSWIQQGLVTEGKKTFNLQNGFHQKVGDNKAMMRSRSQIGSRPPRCETRCRSCGHCEAIQVPTNPQEQQQQQKGKKIKHSKVSTIAAYDRGEYSTNYKPLSWKCKCGNIIFNP